LSGNNSVASRTALASAVINSQEGDTVTIDRLDGEFLHRAPDSAGLNAFLAGFQSNQNAANGANGAGDQNSGSLTNGSGTQQEDPAQAGITQRGGGTNGSNSGQTSGLTLEQAMVDILSSPEYFALADR
jgi:hypothetical protein